jgi:hypothetical protein
MISLQPAFFISVRLPLIMVKTIAATMEQIAPKRAQSTHEGMLMVAVMMNDHSSVKREAVSNDENRKNAMTLTPLFQRRRSCRKPLRRVNRRPTPGKIK